MLTVAIAALALLLILCACATGLLRARRATWAFLAVGLLCGIGAATFGVWGDQHYRDQLASCNRAADKANEAWEARWGNAWARDEHPGEPLPPIGARAVQHIPSRPSRDCSPSVSTALGVHDPF